MTDYDKITLQIWTDGSIDPDEALKQASHVLVQHFQMIADYREVTSVGGGVELPEIKGGSEYLIPQRIYDTPIEELDLTVRAFNCLKRSGITRVGQVLTMSQEDLLAVRNFGEKSLNELKDTLIARGLLPSVGGNSNHSSADDDGDLEFMDSDEEGE
jgi:DNA-directed RNA polymerase subunit alpha